METILREVPDIHKLYSIDQQWCYLTDRRSNRYKITQETEMFELLNLLKRIR